MLSPYYLAFSTSLASASDELIHGRVMHRILIVSNFFPPYAIGGAEVVALRQAKALQARGHEVVVLAGKGDADGLSVGSVAIDFYDGLKVYRLRLRSLEADDNFCWPSGRRRMETLLNTFQPDIVHFHNSIGMGVDMIAAAALHGSRVLITLHDYWGFCFKNTLLRNTGKLCEDPGSCAVCHPTIPVKAYSVPMRLRRDYVATALGYADILLSPSDYLATAYRQSGVINRPVQRLSHGIDLSHRLSRSSAASNTVSQTGAPLRFVCLSYIGEHKGIATLLNAAEMLARTPDLQHRWTLTIAGQGELAEGLEADIAACRFDGHVTYAGKLARPDAFKLATESDVTVLPSVWPENEPLSLLEAIAAGSAQIASRIGGTPELVEDGRSGLLVEPGNSEALADAMAALIRVPDRAYRMGARNLARCGDFDEALAIDRLIEIYDAKDRELNRFDEAVILCGGGPPPDGVDLLFHHLHRLEAPTRRLRFVATAWADAELWRRASALWLWSDEDREAIELAGRAVRAGLPIVAPGTVALAALFDRDVEIGTYGNLLEAAGLLLVLGEDHPGMLRSHSRRVRARLLSAVTPRSALLMKAGDGM